MHQIALSASCLYELSLLVLSMSAAHAGGIDIGTDTLLVPFLDQKHLRMLVA